jgi:hypothetical protein
VTDKKFLDNALPVSQEEVKGIFSKLAAMPMASPLVRLFQRASDEKTYVQTRLKGEHDCGIYSAPNLDGLFASLSIRQLHEYVSVTFYPYNLANLEPESERYGHYALAEIVAGPRQTGVWAAGYGNQTAHGIMLDVTKNGLALPSKEARWMLEHLSWFSVITGEYLSLHQQPKFFTGSKERPDGI